MRKTGSELFGERQKRTQDAIELRVPDRVPIWLGDSGYFPVKYVGITYEKAMFETDMLFADFVPDAYFSPSQSIPAPGGVFQAVDCTMIRLPGLRLSPLHSHQAVEKEAMYTEEYDEFLDDPIEFAIRKYLPRVYGVLKPLKNFPQIALFLPGTMMK